MAQNKKGSAAGQTGGLRCRNPGETTDRLMPEGGGVAGVEKSFQLEVLLKFKQRPITRLVDILKDVIQDAAGYSCLLRDT